MKRILVPTDFSENASHAIEYAAETAKAVGAELIILNVYVPPVSMQSAIHAVMAEDVGRETKAAKARLKTIADTIQDEYKGLACTYDVAVGEPVPEILSKANEKKVDLIVMGTQGASKVVNVLFGSNTASVIERASCPVLCIPFNLTYKKPEKILFATNFAYSDIDGAKQLVELAKGFKSSLIFAHVVVGTEETDAEREVIEKFASEIKLQTGYPQISGTVISDATINTGLDALIEKHGADIIALATRKRNVFQKLFNPSITKKYSYHTTVPLLAFHNPADEEQTGKDF
ncbi:MAG: universal stress protein [Cyclobacteriaceae bacterium]|nr:universal stress protein [Cyclobacteriaceae bacterium]